MQMTYNFLASDQYGNQVWIKKHPRKELLDHCCRQHAEKMYIDVGIHIGYVIAQRWFIVYRISSFKSQL